MKNAGFITRLLMFARRSYSSIGPRPPVRQDSSDQGAACVCLKKSRGRPTKQDLKRALEELKSIERVGQILTSRRRKPPQAA
jgi:hypothetical protein